LSYRLCPIAARQDLIRSAQLNPDIAAEYAQGETHLGVLFKKNLTMQRINQLAREG